MRVIGIVGSPRVNGNTEILTRHTLGAMEEEGFDTELIRLAKMDIRPCNACMVCKMEESCPIDDDLFPLYTKMKAAEAIVLASPVYFSAASGLMKSFMDRAGYIAKNNKAFTGKVGGPLVVARRGGANFTFSELLLWYYILGFNIPGSTYWNIAFGGDRGEVRNDEEGLTNAWNFGKNVAYLVKKLKT